MGARLLLLLWICMAVGFFMAGKLFINMIRYNLKAELYQVIVWAVVNHKKWVVVP